MLLPEHWGGNSCSASTISPQSLPTLDDVFRHIVHECHFLYCVVGWRWKRHQLWLLAPLAHSLQSLQLHLLVQATLQSFQGRQLVQLHVLLLHLLPPVHLGRLADDWHPLMGNKRLDCHSDIFQLQCGLRHRDAHHDCALHASNCCNGTGSD